MANLDELYRWLCSNNTECRVMASAGKYTVTLTRNADNRSVTVSRHATTFGGALLSAVDALEALQ